MFTFLIIIGISAISFAGGVYLGVKNSDKAKKIKEEIEK